MKKFVRSVPKRWGKGRRKRDGTNRKFDDTETRRQLPDGNGFGPTLSRNQSGDVTLCDDTCGRDYSDRHFDRVTRLAAVGLSESVMYRARNMYSLGKFENAFLSPPASIFLFLSLSRDQQSDFNQSDHVTVFGRRGTLLHFGCEESCRVEQ